MFLILLYMNLNRQYVTCCNIDVRGYNFTANCAKLFLPQKQALSTQVAHHLE